MVVYRTPRPVDDRKPSNMLRGSFYRGIEGGRQDRNALRRAGTAAEPTCLACGQRPVLIDERQRLPGGSNVSLEAYTEEIVASGFPGLRGTTGVPGVLSSMAVWPESSSGTSPELGRPARNPSALRHWMTLRRSDSDECPPTRPSGAPIPRDPPACPDDGPRSPAAAQ